jgi:hypothetical protein
MVQTFRLHNQATRLHNQATSVVLYLSQRHHRNYMLIYGPRGMVLFGMAHRMSFLLHPYICKFLIMIIHSSRSKFILIPVRSKFIYVTINLHNKYDNPRTCSVVFNLTLWFLYTKLIAHRRPGLVAFRGCITEHHKANVGRFNCYILQCTTFVQIVRQFYTHLLPGKSLAWFHESTGGTATSQSLMEREKRDHTVTTPSQEHEQHQDDGRGSQFPCGMRNSSKDTRSIYFEHQIQQPEEHTHDASQQETTRSFGHWWSLCLHLIYHQ